MQHGSELYDQYTESQPTQDVREPDTAHINSKQVGDHIAETTRIAAPVQTITSLVGVVFIYYNPDMPIEVAMACIGLFGYMFNVLYVAVIKYLGGNAT